MKIGNKIIGDGYPVYIIAEVGSNHNGKLDEAIKLIESFAAAGADAIKFQLFKAEHLYTKSDPRYDATIPFETPREWIPKLVEVAKKFNVHLSASPFDFNAVDVLVNNEVPFIKIASPEIRDYSLMNYCSDRGIPVIISTGVSNIIDIGRAINVFESQNFLDLIILQCTSVYPCPPSDLNLNVIRTLKNTFEYPVGLSDHSMSILAPSLAVTLGACVIEKHVTLDRLGSSPDSKISITLDEFKDMVLYIREAEKTFGNRVKKVLKNERLDLHQKSIVAVCNIKKGEKISKEKLIIKRGEGGLSPFLIEEINGVIARKNISKDDVITFKHI